ncbi:endo-1,4-beta-xylanase, partial [Candidatus Riflebacteria bacterium]
MEKMSVRVTFSFAYFFLAIFLQNLSLSPLIAGEAQELFKRYQKSQQDYRKAIERGASSSHIRALYQEYLAAKRLYDGGSQEQIIDEHGKIETENRPTDYQQISKIPVKKARTQTQKLMDALYNAEAQKNPEKVINAIKNYLNKNPKSKEREKLIYELALAYQRLKGDLKTSVFLLKKLEAKKTLYAKKAQFRLKLFAHGRALQQLVQDAQAKKMVLSQTSKQAANTSWFNIPGLIINNNRHNRAANDFYQARQKYESYSEKVRKFAETSARNLQENIPLKIAFHRDFAMGLALNSQIISGEEEHSVPFIARHFNTITPENEMKWASLQPEEGNFIFKNSDKIVEFALENEIKTVGHTLIWHNQTPEWVFEKTTGTPASRELLLSRMQKHIEKVVHRYRGKVPGWDVVNEAIDDAPEILFRNSRWLEIIGEDFIEHAFRYTHEADPDAELYYNDYNLAFAHKRKKALAMIKRLQARDIPITAIGMQAHWQLDSPTIEQIENSIIAFSNLGIKVMITELDIDVLP